MAPRTHSDTFSFSELALAGDINKSAFQFLDGTGLLPGGRGIRDFKRVATIGAFMAGGVPLIVAARIAKALLVEFDEADGEAPTGLKAAAEAEVPEEITGLVEPNDLTYHGLIVGIWQRRMREILASGKPTSMNGVPVTSDDYWKYVEQLRTIGGYYAGLVPAMQSDVRIEICDRRHVFMLPTSRLKRLGETRELFQRHPEALDMEAGFVGWIEGWERGTEARLKHVSEVIPLSKYDDWVSAQALRLQITVEQEILHNPVGKLGINVSLAVRRALDRLAEHRAGRGKAKA